MNDTKAGRPTRVQYKTYIALLPSEWAKLGAESKKRSIPGRELIEAALSQYCAKLPVPAREDPDPLPEPDD